ncbi:hypothetical protein [Aquibacillus sediminis]|uniref:hypothetical protein n=1 Tax=Aquibacillus sediminis TaxID=2574734 RepID=UPI001109B72F|nr:hypothetical protein [Aquibacillus sediminis]
MKKSEEGFLMVEVLASFMIVTTITLTLIPIVYQLRLEEQILAEQREIVYRLHDELQPLLFESVNKSFPINFVKNIDGNPVSFSFSLENKLIKGCADWTDAKQNSKTFCLYGYE